MSNFLKKLQAYDLFTFQSRIYDKILTFTYVIRNKNDSPAELKENINQLFHDDNSLNDMIQASYEPKGGSKTLSQKINKKRSLLEIFLLDC